MCSFLSLYSCQMNKSQDMNNVIEIDLSKCSKTKDMSDFIETVESIRLELPDSLFFGVVTNVLFSDSNIYIVDNKQKSIFRFHKNGVFLNTVGKRGEGPNEYISFKTCFLADNTVFVNDLGRRTIYYYTPDGELIKKRSFSFDLIYDNIMYLSDNSFLCHSLSKSYNNCRGIWIMDEHGEKKETLYLNERKCPYLDSAWNTLSVINNNEIGIYEPPTGHYYIFDKTNKKLNCRFQLKSNMKMLGDIETSDIMEVNEEYAYCDIMIDANNYVFSLWALPDQTGVFSLYSKQTRKQEAFSYPSFDLAGVFDLGTIVASNISNTLVTLFTDDYLKEFYPKKYDELKMGENVLVLNRYIFK